MTEPKFTPGPWDKSPVGFVHKNGVLHPKQINETRLEGESWIDMRHRLADEFAAREEEAKANAHLIAAAPEMYQALVAVHDLNENGGPFGGEIYQDRVDRAWDKVRAAISKAEGGEA